MCIISQKICDLVKKESTPCLQGSASVLTAMEIMDMYEVDIVGIECEDNFAGIFSRGDFTRNVIRNNLNPKYTTLYEVMILNPFVVGLNTTIKEVYEAMLAHQWEYIPVLEGKKLRGIVSIHDLGKDVIKSFEDARAENEILINYIQGGESYAIASYRN